MKEVWFHDLYETSQPEYLTSLLCNKYGYTDPNPGPVVAYPPNLFLFPTGIPGKLEQGTRIAIPWTRERLEKQIKIDLTWIADRKAAASRAIAGLNKEYKGAAWVGQAVDVAAFVILFATGIAKTAAQYVKALEKPAALAKLGTELAFETKVAGGQGLGAVVGLDPSAFTGKGGEPWKNVVRHATNLASPSYWAAIFITLFGGKEYRSEGWEIWKHGLDTVHERNIERIIKDLQSDAGGMALKISAMDRQTKMPFYKYRISASQRVYTLPSSAHHVVAGCVTP